MEAIQINIPKRWKQALVYTLFFLLLTHGYRYLHTSFAHDSIAFASSEDIAWKISLGRFMQPVYWLIRGKIAAPFVVGIFSYLWLVPCVLLIADILRIQSGLGVFLLSGVLTGSLTLVSANAAYIHEADTFLLAMLLNILAVRLSLNKKWSHWAAALVLVIAGAGLYQAFAQVFASLVMVWAVRALLGREESVGAVWGRCIRSAAVLVLGIGAYLALSQGIMEILRIAPESGYNGITSIGDYSDSNILKIAVWTWLDPIHFFLRALPGRVSPFFAGAHLLVLAYAGGMTLFLIKKNNLSKPGWISVLAILALLPLGMNCMYPVSKGFTHDLIRCAYCFGEIYAIAVTEYAWSLVPAEGESRRTYRLRRVLPIILCLMFLSKAMWANREYLKKDLEDDSTRAVMVRILDRVEQLEGYEPGVTPVHFVGILDESPLVQERSNFKPLSALTGSWFAAALTYEDDYWTYWSYFEDVMGYPIAAWDGTMTPEQQAMAEEMPPFPARDSVQLTEGLVLVKLS